MRNRTIAALAALLLGAFAAAPNALAQMPKSGSYSLPAGLIANGQLMELGKDHLHWFGGFKGAGVNTQGAFMKVHSWECSGATDIVNGTASGSGYCRVVDQDGDAAFVKYAGKNPAGAPVTGRGEWIGGTGKYTGIRGGHSYICHAVGPADYACVADGKYELP
jgi:hypothetical protein